MKFPSGSSSSHGTSGSSSGGSLAFSLSSLLAEKMAFARPGSLPASSLRGRIAGLATGWRTSGVPESWGERGGTGGAEAARSAFLVTRCPASTMARLDTDGGCFCGKLTDAEASPCHGFDENDRRAICVEDLRKEGSANGDGTMRRRRATCGLEFLPGFEPQSEECPVGYARVGDPERDGKEHFICQDAASPYSCGARQTDCYAQEGVLRAACVEGHCEILMCQEGWRFHLTDNDDGPQGMGMGTSCVPAKPLFFNLPPA
ncbi:hypothetical protein JCM21900_004790 [Sporobolomyces salmonicolor]